MSASPATSVARSASGPATDAVSTVLQAVASRRSYSKVTASAPTHAELLPLIAAAARGADHGALRPWRLLELRGDSRERLGAAFVAASAALGVACVGDDARKLAAKPLRAPLLLAIVASRRASEKVTGWEQDAATAGVAHLLVLLLEDVGWGSMWRTGPFVRTAPVRELHELADSEELLGWLYIGGIPEDCKPGVRLSIDASDFITAL